MVLTARAGSSRSGRATLVGWRLISLLSLVAFAARASTLGNPIVQVDEEFYLLVARSMLHGAAPYVDLWDRKPIGLFLTYVPPALLPPAASVWAYQILALGSVVATALLIVRLARRVGWGRGAVGAACFYLLWLDLADGQGGQAPVFYNLLVASGVTLALGNGRAPVTRRALAAMLVFGLAIQVKYTVMFEGVWIGLWLTWQAYSDSNLPRTLGFAAVLALVALVPTALALAVYAALGQAHAFVFANFISIFGRHPDPVADQVDDGLTAMALLGPLVLMAGAGRRDAAATAWERQGRRMLYGWLAAAVLGLAAFGGWYNHYTLPVMLPGAVCSAGFLSRPHVGRWFTVPAVLLLFVLGQVIVAADVGRRGTPAQFATIVRAIGTEPGTLYVDWGEPAFYTFSGKRPLSRYVFPTHLQLAREAGAIGVDQGREVARILARRPDVVLMMGPIEDTKEETGILSQVSEYVRRAGYRGSKRLPLGRLWAIAYHRVRAKES